MKKPLLMIAFVAGLASFSSCDSKKENTMEEQAEQVEEAAEMSGDTTLQRQAEQAKDSIDAEDPK